MNNMTFIPNFINIFLKSERKKHYTLNEMSNIIGWSTSTISRFENNDNPLKDARINKYITLLNYNLKDLRQVDLYIDDIVDDYIHHIFYHNNKQAQETLEKIRLLLEPFHDSILFSLYDYFLVIWNIHHHRVIFKEVEAMIQNLYFFNQKIQFFLQLYITYFYFSQHRYEIAGYYLKNIKELTIEDEAYQAMLHYYLATYYARTDSPTKSQEETKKAYELFVQTNNTKRIADLYVQWGLQCFLKRDLNKSIAIYLEYLEKYGEDNHNANLKTVLNNLGFAYIILENYKSAVQYYEMIDKTTLNQDHYFSLICCYIMNEEPKKANAILEEAWQCQPTQYYSALFQIFAKYLQKPLPITLVNSLLFVFYKYFDHINSYSREQLLSFISAFLKQHHYFNKAAQINEIKYLATWNIKKEKQLFESEA